MSANTSLTTGIEYQPSKIYTWQQQPDEAPVCTLVDCRHAIIGFRIREAPEFNEIQDAQASQNYIDALLRQKSMLDAVSGIFFSNTPHLTGVLELRLANNPDLKTVNCYLLLRLVLTSNAVYYNTARLQEEFRRLIPDEYFTTPMTQDEIEHVLQLDNRKVVEIRKATNLLPVGTFFHDSSGGIAPRNLAGWDMNTRYHLPCVSYLEPKANSLSYLFKTLQHAGESVQIRISVGAAQVFEPEKNIALQYHAMLKATYASIATPEIMANMNGYTKYSSAAQLFSLKIQVAASSEATAMSVANTFCSQLAYGEVKTQTNLHCFPLRKTDAAALQLDWELCNHPFYPPDLTLPDAEDVEDVIVSFAARMPYISDGSEIMAVFRLPLARASGLPGMTTSPVKPFYQPGPAERAPDDVLPLGHVITAPDNKHQARYGVPLQDLTKHGLIVGATGSGKTNTTLNFVRELIERDIPFLMIEPVKAEYYHQLAPVLEAKGKKLKRFDLSRPRLDDGAINPDFLRFNPFVPQPGISTFQHLSYIKSCFTAAFPMFGILPMVLDDCLYEFTRLQMGWVAKEGQMQGQEENNMFLAARSMQYWAQVSLKDGKDVRVNNTTCTLRSFSDYVSQYMKDNAGLFDPKVRSDIEGALVRRLMRLCKGLMGQIFCPENWREVGKRWPKVPDNMDIILNQPCIIELEALPDNEDKALIMAFLLTYLFESRQTRVSHSRENQLHVTLIEEAHRLLSASSMKSGGSGENANLAQDSGTKTVSLFIDMLAEIRSRNEAIFIIEQSPTKLVADAIKNTNLKIMHRLTNKSDRDYLGEAMNMDGQQSRYATTLKQGEALVFEEQLDKPILVKMNRF